MFPSISPFSRSCLFVLLSSVLITACNSSDTTSSASALDTGDVALLITDGPTADFDEVNVVADSVILIGEGPDAHLMTQPVTINLLDLRNSFSMLSDTDAPVGTYSKVRLSVSNVELVKLNPDGSVSESITPKLEANIVDLNAQEQFVVEPGGELIVKLDLDADKSLHINQTGNGYIFRPQVFVEIVSVPADTGEDPPVVVTPLLMNELGVVRNVLTDSFQLCNPDLPDDCVQVNVSPDTVLMDSTLQVVGIGDIAENTLLQVFGHLDVTTDTINALHVLQDSSRLNTYTGTLSGDVVNDQINLNITAGSEAGRTYPVISVSQSGVGVYDSAGNVLDVSALGGGVNVEVIGILNTFPSTELQPGVVIIAGP